MRDALFDAPPAPAPIDHARAMGTALWVFIGVASALFALFLAAYAMRILAPDWTPIVLPARLWAGAAALVAASALLELGARAARARRLTQARGCLLGAGAAGAAFLVAQTWGWQALLDAGIGLASHPAASFFYLLSALHGLHVIGGLIAWSVAAPPLWSADRSEAVGGAWRVALCARYWHFLLVLWAVLVAALAWTTPELVREICGLD
jgi:cytochrome c oxidase subunit III